MEAEAEPDPVQEASPSKAKTSVFELLEDDDAEPAEPSDAAEDPELDPDAAPRTTSNISIPNKKSKKVGRRSAKHSHVIDLPCHWQKKSKRFLGCPRLPVHYHS